MPCCAVAVCTNVHKKTRHRGVTYHIFPKNPKLLKIWVKKCRRRDHFNVSNARMCSDHFLPTDYEDDMRNRLLGLKPRKILKPDAVPSVKLSTSDTVNQEISSRTERTKNRSVRQRALNRLRSLSPKRVDDSLTVDSDSGIDNQLHGSGTAAKEEEKKDHIPLEPTVEIKEEPTDYQPNPSTSSDPANEEFILPHEDNSWTTPDSAVEPQFTLSVANLSSPNRPEASDGEQLKKKRKTNEARVVGSTNGPTVSPVYNCDEFSSPAPLKEHRKDEFDVFGEYIAVKLRNLDRRSCAYAQKAIGDVIFEAEMGKYLNQTQNSKS